MRAVLPPTIRARTIMAAAAAHYGVTVHDLKGPWRAAHVVHARHVAMAVTKDLTRLSLPAIGREFGNRDHTTVYHAIDRIRSRKPGIAEEIAEVADLAMAATEPSANSAARAQQIASIRAALQVPPPPAPPDPILMDAMRKVARAHRALDDAMYSRAEHRAWKALEAAAGGLREAFETYEQEKHHDQRDRN